MEEPMAVEGGELTDPLFTLSPPWPGGPGVHHPPPPPQVRPRPPGGHRPLRSQGTKVFHHPLLSLSSAISHPQAPGVRDDGSKVHGGHGWRGEPETTSPPLPQPPTSPPPELAPSPGSGGVLHSKGRAPPPGAGHHGPGAGRLEAPG